MQEKARRIIMNYFNDHVDVTDGKRITMDDVLSSGLPRLYRTGSA